MYLYIHFKKVFILHSYEQPACGYAVSPYYILQNSSKSAWFSDNSVG